MSVHLFFGSVTGVAAELYVRLPGGSITGGSVSGPRSAYARTLESSVPLTPVDAARSLWRARLEEPCFWTPRNPYLYAARIETADKSGGREQLSLTLGVPVLVAHDRQLESEGKNWVVRAMRASGGGQFLVPACHETGTSLFVDCPGDELCESASVAGVQLIADLSAVSPGDIETELRRVARWPAIGIAILPQNVELDPALHRETAHVIRAQTWSDLQREAPRDWAQVLVVDYDELVASDRAVLKVARAHGRGLIVRRRVANLVSGADAESQVALGRQACDSLQAELARQFSGTLPLTGYMVD